MTINICGSSQNADTRTVSLRRITMTHMKIAGTRGASNGSLFLALPRKTVLTDRLGERDAGGGPRPSRLSWIPTSLESVGKTLKWGINRTRRGRHLRVPKLSKVRCILRAPKALHLRYHGNRRCHRIARTQECRIRQTTKGGSHELEETDNRR